MTMATMTTPLNSLRVIRHHIPAHGLLPNTSIQDRPLLHYLGVFPSAAATAATIESHLTSIDVVQPQWRFTMYSTTHFHSTTHEVLCISNGRARLCFGGDDNSHKVVTEATKGDVLVLPAGVAHRLVEDLTEHGCFEMVGSYPKGCHWDMCYGSKDEESKVRGISNVPWFDRDPVYGSQGPVLQA